MATSTDPLPDLEPGVTMLHSDDRGTLAALVAAALEGRDGPVRWVDARNHASTFALSEAGRTHRILDKIQVARAFTAHQHHALVRQLVAAVRRPTAFVVAPAVDDLYADDDLLAQEADRLRAATLSTLSALADARDLPVLVTASDESVVAEYVDTDVEVADTRFGPRFESDDDETTAYWTRGGWQTTIPYWVDLVGAVSEPAPVARPEVVA